MSEPLLSSLPQLLLNAPLYEVFSLGDDITILRYIYGKRVCPTFDGHCPFCNKETTFTLSGNAHIADGTPWNNIKTTQDIDRLTIQCSRHETHKVLFYFHLSQMKVQKIGQLPSFADIANDEVKQYRKMMSSSDAAEFHKAIGLAAHGVGVGSFVYLRRVFERLIYSRFNEFKEIESWKEEEFKMKRMEEKITFLKGHLPDFLVKNSRIYSILSIGIHELEEDKCLAAFNILKDSIIVILEEDKKKKEELLLRTKLEASIAAFEA